MCAFHPATLGSSPKHTIYAFIICSHIRALWKEQKEARIGTFKKETDK